MKVLHNHIERKAYPYGSCPSCDVVWDVVLTLPSDLFDAVSVFRVAEQLVEDYGVADSLNYLTEKQEYAQYVKAKVDAANFKL